MSTNVQVSASEEVAVLLLDIEGTTTAISFVHAVLFPFARNNVRQYLEQNVQSLDNLDPLYSSLLGPSPLNEPEESAAPPTELAEYITAVEQKVYRLMDVDAKWGPLKTLQGRIWEQAYASKKVFGHVFPDVLPAIQRWRERGLRVCIYSSGSVPAQKLLFGHLEEQEPSPDAGAVTGGDALSLFDGFFDTQMGAKIEKESYVNIANALGVTPQQITFLTDRYPEAVAARLAGAQAILLDRPGNGPLSPEERSEFPVITTFSDILFR